MKPRLIVTVLVAALLAGCGGSSNGESAENATPSRDAQADASAAQAAVQRFVDRNDCSVASDRFLEEFYAESGGDPREACEDDPFEGLRGDDYTVHSSEARGTRATVLLSVDDGSVRRYTLIRKGDRWLIDDLTNKAAAQRVALGKALWQFDS